MFDQETISLKNIIRSPKTTGYGVVIFILSILFVYLDKAQLSEVWPVWLFVAWLLFGKDKQKPKATKTTIILALIASFAITSCSPQKRLARLVKKNPELIQQVQDTVKIDTFIIQRPVLEYFSVPYDFTDSFKLTGSTFDLSFYKDDDLGTFDIEVKTKPDTLYIEVNVPVEYSNIKVTPKPKPEKRTSLKEYIILIGGMLLGILFLILIIKLTRK